MATTIDIVVVVDTTGSMDNYLRALEQFIPQLLAIRTITHLVFSQGSPSSSTTSYIDRIGVLAYSDYHLASTFVQGSVRNPIPSNDEAAKRSIPKLEREDVLKWSGWDKIGSNSEEETGPTGGKRLVEWVRGLSTEGGGDYPEATKTALRWMLDLVSNDNQENASTPKQTLALWYTDSPPHHRSHRSLNRLLEITAHSPSVDAEKAALTKNSPLNSKQLNAATPLPPTVPIESCIDWIGLCLATRNDPSKSRITVWSILPPTMPDRDLAFYACLGTISNGGTCVIGGPKAPSPDDVEKNQEDEQTSPKRKSEKKDQQIEDVGALVSAREFIERIVETSRTIAIAAVGWSESRSNEVTKPDKDDHMDEGKGAVEPMQDWLRLVRFEDNIEEHLPTGPPEEALRALPPPRNPDGKEVEMKDVEDKGKEPNQEVIYNEDEGSLGFLPPSWNGPQPHRMGTQLRDIIREGIDCAALAAHYRKTPTTQQAEDAVTKETLKNAFANWDTRQQASIVALLGVVETDVRAISKVGAFSELWMGAMTLPPGSTRDTLVAEYTARVRSLRDADEEEKQKLLDWAQINYDASHEVCKLLEEGRIEATSEGYVDGKGILVLDEDAVRDVALTKEGVLELTRSVDVKVLKRLTDMLRYTRLVVPSEAPSRSIDLSTTNPPVIFRVIPHLAFEGLMYSPRTAVILAMLALFGQVPHLTTPARQLLESTKGTWLTSNTPGNFTPEFTHFILSLPASIVDLAFSEEERTVYEGMAHYSVMEKEMMDRKVDALVPWTPNRTRGIGDRKRLCVGCGIIRSETMMVQVGSYEFKREDAVKDAGKDDGMRCGMCVDSEKNPLEFRDMGVMQSCWVECSERWCRAQYVIEDEEALLIPPRCYYCRKSKACPWIECTICTNRIILPKSYRVPAIDTHTNFVCPPCQFSRPLESRPLVVGAGISYTGHKTIVHKLTTLRSILFANDYEVGWLGIKPFSEVFKGRSTFMIWELHGSSAFMPYTPISDPQPALRAVTPSTPSSTSTGQRRQTAKRKRLLVNGKALLNPQGVKDELYALADRALKRGVGRCPLSFEYVREGEGWVTSCGNDECEMRASRKGLDEWMRGDGEVRKSCPACQREPVAFS